MTTLIFLGFFEFIEITLGNVLALLALIAVIAVAAGYAFYSFRTQKPKVKTDVIAEWSAITAALEKRLGLLSEDLQRVEGEHARCQLKINEITAFNLRLQGREIHYQRTINKLERNLGWEITDFNDVTATPEDSAFRR